MAEDSTSQDFVWQNDEEPHASRRKAILEAHPEIKNLFGPCDYLKYQVVAVVALQLSVAYAVRSWDITTWQYWSLVYVVGATANHNLFLAIHEISHNLAFKGHVANRLLGIFANLPIGIPYTAAFKGYHLEHHRYQGTEGVDTDLPTETEALIFRGVFGKAVFCFCQILFYALRPMIVRRQVFTSWHIINWIVQFSFVALLIQYCGWKSYLYLLFSDFLAGSYHPMAGHFIAEHYIRSKGYETYSYYGPWNILGYNVGYHNEHHDFPYVPGSRLPMVRKIAPEFYDDHPSVSSWPGTIVDFILNPKMTLYSRVKRHNKANEE